MATKHDIANYRHGETLQLSITLSNDAGLVTSGTVVFRAGQRGQAALVELPLTHAGSGLWTLDANASALAPLTSGAVFGYEIWETASARVFLTGELRVNRSLSVPT
ncbi:hypothetical protein [Salipiger aestuarii]|uniref:hypothetical protein n=1 Tax=Salipiger aestuarii TaxID=568098 RepID=UPI0012399E34|nr:hypothetical protein [Salipiger aestuarii]KAA8606186.1 hypothetical protein AL037_20710 [Salipiger aestuarii]